MIKRLAALHALNALRAAFAVGCIVCAFGVIPAIAQHNSTNEQRLPNPEAGQPPTPLPVPATEPQHFTRIDAETLLNDSGAASLFEIISLDQDRIALRHRGSGLVCRFLPGRQNRINATRPSDANSNVGCVSGPWPNTLSAAIRNRRIDPSVTVDALQHTFRQQFPNARAFQPDRQFWPEPTGNMRFLHLIAQNDEGETNVIHAVAIRRGDWTLICRLTYSSTSDMVTMAAELAAAAHFQAILSDLES